MNMVKVVKMVYMVKVVKMVKVVILVKIGEKTSSLDKTHPVGHKSFLRVCFTLFMKIIDNRNSNT